MEKPSHNVDLKHVKGKYRKANLGSVLVTLVALIKHEDSKKLSRTLFWLMV